MPGWFISALLSHTGSTVKMVAAMVMVSSRSKALERLPDIPMAQWGEPVGPLPGLGQLDKVPGRVLENEWEESAFTDMDNSCLTMMVRER